MKNLFESDFLVIGSGIAGLSFALRAAELGEVTVITKKEQCDSSTNYAQGGIACVMGGNDEFSLHIEDTLTCGAGLCKKDVVETVVREGPALIQALIDWGVEFTRKSGGDDLDLGREGGHSRRRIVHAKDLTGQEVERALLERVRLNDRIQIYEHQVAIDLLFAEQSQGRRCVGVRAIDSLSGDFRLYVAGMVLLATGGVGRVYLHTTNPPIATGDGVVMAYRAGAVIANMEFIQFHPTSLYQKDEVSRAFLISEAVRGEGGVLRTLDGESFMQRYHPLACLAPRDVVARSIDNEMKHRGDPCVLLDLTHLQADFIKDHFPNIHKHCLGLGLDITKEPIPVVPAAHYSCGGVLTDLDGQSSISGLFATGEASCTGLHGANRLASNSLLEALVFSNRAFLKIASQQERFQRVAASEIQLDFPALVIDESFEAVRLRHCAEELVRTMWDYVGIVRSNERLHLARQRTKMLQSEIDGYFRRGLCSGSLVELRNMVQCADLIVRSALRRKESRGLHFNLDYPAADDKHWKKDTILTLKQSSSRNSGRGLS